MDRCILDMILCIRKIIFVVFPIVTVSYFTRQTILYYILYQYVVLDYKSFNPTMVTFGVSQGSLLFNIYINDIYKRLKFVKFLIYVDDLKIYHVISGQEYVTNL